MSRGESRGESARTPDDAATGGGSRLRTAAQWLRAWFLGGGRWHFWVNFVNLVAILGASAFWGLLLGNATVAVSLLGALLVFYGSLLALIRNSNAATPRLWAPFTLLSVCAAVALVTVVSGLVTLVGHYTAVDIKPGITHNRAMRTGNSATVKLHGAGSRTRLSITFHLEDHDSGQSPCTPRSSLEVAPPSGSPKKAHSDEPMEFSPAPSHLTVKLRNEPRCPLDLSVAKAALDN